MILTSDKFAFVAPERTDLSGECVVSNLRLESGVIQQKIDAGGPGGLVEVKVDQAVSDREHKTEFSSPEN